MVARTPPKLPRKMVAPLDPTLLRETVNKVDKCMARLQELQCTVTGGNKVISGVTLSPRSTKGYLRTSLRCKQESLRMKNANPRRSPPGKLPTNTGEWRRMSLPAMLLGETVGEILQASQFAREIVDAVAVASKANKNNSSEDPKTPISARKRRSPEKSEHLRARRKREKEAIFQSIRSESDNPSLQGPRSRINFKVVSPCRKREESQKENSSKYLANRVSPRNKPWARKAVLFPNPLFHSSPNSRQQKFSKTKSPVISRKNTQSPHKFLIKSPPSASKLKVKSPQISISSTGGGVSGLSRRKSPKAVHAAAAKLRRSFSPSRLANRLVSPLKSRKSVQKSDGGEMMMSGLKQRPISTTVEGFSARRI